MQFSSVTSVSPSFTGNSSNNLADIAARVIQEFRNENGHEDDDDLYNFTDDGNQEDLCAEDESNDNCIENLNENEDEHDEDREFEFAVVCGDPDLSPALADEIFFNGEILPRYPLFDRSLLLEDRVSVVSPVVRHPLGKLFKEERESPSEVDNLDGLAPGTYCIWKPKVESTERCKKSNSTGNTSKRWWFRSLLKRSNSDGNMTAGKHAPVIDFSPFSAAKKKAEKTKKVDKTAKVAGADDGGEPTEMTNESNSINKGGNRLQSFLRLKRDQIGVSANVSR